MVTCPSSADSRLHPHSHARHRIDPKTRAKFHVLGGDYLRTLTKYIDSSQIPPALGGSAPWDLSVVQPWDMSVTYSDNPWKYRPLSDAAASSVDESEFADVADAE
jgi:hypothetical protein